MIRPFHFFAAVLLLFLSTGCDSNDNSDNEPSSASSPAVLIGNWDMASLTDKTGEQLGTPESTIDAGQPVVISFDFSGDGNANTITIIVDGSISFTSSRYAVETYVYFEVSGFPEPIEDTVTDVGDYTVAGNTISFMTDNPDEENPEVELLGYSLVNGLLIIEDDEQALAFQPR